MSQPFHAGGAATNLHFLHSNGIAQLKDLLTGRTQSLDITLFGSLIAIAGVAPVAFRYIQHAWHGAASWTKRWFICSVTIPAGDPLNRSVSTWIHENIVEQQTLRFHTARTDVSPRDLEAGATLKKSQRSILYLPHWESKWFRHESTFFQVNRCMDSFKKSVSDPTYEGVGGEEITISCLGRSATPIRELIDVCRAYAEKKQQFYVIIYSRDRFGMSWKPRMRRPLRKLETVHFDNRLKQALITDLQNYLDDRTRQLYQSRSMPYRRGYLFYGPPGTGKSSLSTAIAGHFGLDLYEVKVPSIATDADLEQMFQEIPPRCIVLLEDIDAIWSPGREQRRINDGDSDRDSNHSLSNVTLSGLLNVLDGVGSQEGRVVIMTSNKPEQLDNALIRPGRVDFKLYLGSISRHSAEQMFLRMFSPDLLNWARTSSMRARSLSSAQAASISADKLDSLERHISLEQLKMLASQFASEIPENTFTPSQLQGYFQMHLSSAVLASSNIAAWVKKELASRSEGEFEVC